ncbi:MAG: DICT sensory domain-containing protein [Propionibacteriaceae bacterium]
MTTIRTEHQTTSIETMLRRAAIPATSQLVLDLQTRRAVAIKVITSDLAEPLDAVTIVRTLNLMAAHQGRPVGPVIIEVPRSTLLTVAPAGQHSEHPMILSLLAEGLLDHPAESLRLVQRARELGWEIGLRGVGRSTATLAAVSVFEPSLVTLAVEILADPASALAVETLQTVTAFRHATGATVMAEPLDSGTLRHTAQSLGATIGSGDAVPRDTTELPAELDYTLDLFVSPRQPEHQMSPYEISIQRHQSQRAHRSLVASAGRRIEQTARTSGRSSIVLACFQHARHLTPSISETYSELAGHTEMIMLAAGGLRRAPAAGVSWTDLARHDTLRREWTVLLLAPTTAMLLAAREVRRASKHDEREFDYTLSYERDLVAHAARSLLTRLPTRDQPRRLAP